jgi:hypothetical protein
LKTILQEERQNIDQKLEDKITEKLQQLLPNQQENALVLSSPGRSGHHSSCASITVIENDKITNPMMILKRANNACLSRLC